ncbi:MAG: DUF3040 domain-containing protein [Candidatus Nanopelagicaceae bacterium]
MGLTDREKKIIEEMEAALTAEDPRLVASMGQHRPNIALNVLGVLLGLGLILAGVIANFAPLGVAGFLVALASAATVRGRIGAVKFKAPKSNRIQDRWDRRNQ